MVVKISELKKIVDDLKKKKINKTVIKAPIQGKIVKGVKTKTSIKVEPQKIIPNAFGFIGSALNPLTLPTMLFGSRESKAKIAAKVIPATVKTIETKTNPFKKSPNKKFEALRTGLFKKYTTSTKIIPFSEKVTETIEKQKTTPEGKQYWETPVIGASDIKLPELPEIKLPDIFGGLKEAGKWVLIGGLILVAVLIISRRKK